MRITGFLILFFAVVLSSCMVLNSGNVSSGPLLHVTDQYVDIATGESQAVEVLWITPKLKSRMVLEAKVALFKNRPLRQGEYYSNFSCDISKTLVLGLVFITNVTVSAEVLHTGDPGKGAGKDSVLKNVSRNFNYSIEAYDQKSYFKNAVDSFFIGEKVYYNKPMVLDFAAYEITAIDGNKVSLKPLYQVGSNLLVEQKSIIYSTKKSLNGFKAGDAVEVYLQVVGQVKATVMATSGNRVLVTLDGGGYETVKTEDMKKLIK